MSFIYQHLDGNSGDDYLRDSVWTPFLVIFLQSEVYHLLYTSGVLEALTLLRPFRCQAGQPEMDSWKDLCS